MENPILIIEGDNHTIKDLVALADEKERKVVIIGSHSELTQHVETIQKFSRGSIGVIAVCISQLAMVDRVKIERPKESHKPNGSLTELLKEQAQKLTFEITRLPEPEPIIIHDCNQRRKVKHPQAKPVRQFIPAQKNHHFKRK